MCFFNLGNRDSLCFGHLRIYADATSIDLLRQVISSESAESKAHMEQIVTETTLKQREVKNRHDVGKRRVQVSKIVAQVE